MKHVFEFSAQVFPYPGMAAWRFVALPQALSAEIKTRFGKIKKGWGSIPVLVTVGKTVWETSIFPDKKSQSYLLPMKLEVRKKEGVMDGDVINLCLRVRI
jgi:hypothetical protein